ncbi:Kazal-type serine protease inhibitor domain-containing protein [Allomesorhizobium camelthorni]|uniref:Protease inhibitor n=1 Tax=Allomesorhizobium camelthorni TaxID=475069 RepID=A0A6G4WD80_9HYPH|nr:Kazal-type serine protease inhibitor domain-containing protein [Mesorhizobium camelthorni]NGO52153.1 protease inhibitor [Mesorhizobium camelthorni]
MIRRVLSHSAAFLLLVAGIVSACTVVVEQPRPAPAPVACTLQHDPVCGQRGDRQRTFTNACLARAEGFRVIAQGQCRPIHQCTREIARVCASRAGRLRTFTNSCLARVEGYVIVHSGPCR